MSHCTPIGDFELKRVVFATADVDVPVVHELKSDGPYQICYEVLQRSAGGVVYHDLSLTRKTWQRGTIYLRSTVPMVATIRLSTPIKTIELLAPNF